MTTEIWKPVPGYMGKYLVSNKGRVASAWWGLITRKVPKIMKGSPDKDGYLRLSMRHPTDDSYKPPRTEKVHRLVALVFVPNNTSFDVVNHIDGDKTNNAASNLEWCSVSYNAYHGYQLRKQHGNCE